MTLDTFCWSLFVAAFGGQGLAVCLWWLRERAPREIQRRFGALARLPIWVLISIATLAVFSGFTWGMAATEADVFPAPQIDALFFAITKRDTGNATRYLLCALAMPLYPVIQVMGRQSQNEQTRSEQEPEKITRKRKRKAPKRTRRSEPSLSSRS